MEIIINGKKLSVSGNNVCIKNNTIIVDGNVVEGGLTGNVNVVINGDLNTTRALI